MGNLESFELPCFPRNVKKTKNRAVHFSGAKKPPPAGQISKISGRDDPAKALSKDRSRQSRQNACPASRKRKVGPKLGSTKDTWKLERQRRTSIGRLCGLCSFPLQAACLETFWLSDAHGMEYQHPSLVTSRSCRIAPLSNNPSLRRTRVTRCGWPDEHQHPLRSSTKTGWLCRTQNVLHRTAWHFGPLAPDGRRNGYPMFRSFLPYFEPPSPAVDKFQGCWTWACKMGACLHRCGAARDNRAVMQVCTRDMRVSACWTMTSIPGSSGRWAWTWRLPADPIGNCHRRTSQYK